MRTFFACALYFLLILFTGCSPRHAANKTAEEKKFTNTDLQQDYQLLRTILEKKHPSLYWYTSKAAMDRCFDSAYALISDSMTERDFGWNILAPTTRQIRCGHTSFGMSSAWRKFMKNKQVPEFPLYLKTWNDTMVVLANRDKKDSIFRRGTQVTSINNIPAGELLQNMFRYLPLDGFAENVNYVRLSSNFPYYHRNIYGIYKNYRVGYTDSSGTEKKVLVPLYVPVTDSLQKKQRTVSPLKFLYVFTKKYRLLQRYRASQVRSLQLDTTLRTGYLTLNTFNKKGGYHLRRFVRHTFSTLQKRGVSNLVIDLRGNGGGDVGMFVLLNKYIRKTPFKIADSVSAVTRSLHPYGRYIKNSFWYTLGLQVLTRKMADGRYHYGRMERHWYHPKKRNHYNGHVYVLTNGPTFSAAALFCHSVKGQANVTLVGEETGGGAYGNAGIFIPDIRLPHTGMHVRLPLFRIVQFGHTGEKGRGILPDIYIPPTVEAIRNGTDRKMEFVKQLIQQSSIR